MPNSSDWIAALLSSVDQDSADQKPAWMSVSSMPEGFVEGLPHARVPGGVASNTAETTDASVPNTALDLAELADQPAPPTDPVAEALARGEAIGRAAANAERDAEMQHRKALRLSFREFDSAAIDTLASELAETVIALCAQTVADYEPDAEALTTRCKQAAKRLGKAAREHVLHLNPADIDMLDAETKKHWQIVEDAQVERGGLHFEGPDGAISDGPSDWRRAIAAAIRG